MNLENNTDKLPKWAQNEIRILKMRLEEKTKELERINENPESNTILGNGYQFKDSPIVYLNNNQLITFNLSNGYVQAKIHGDVVEIHTNGGDLLIKPKVSNGFDIKLISA